MSEYPEHDKLHEVKDKSQLLGEFLDWARENNMELCYYDEGNDNGESTDRFSRWRPARRTIEHLLADFYNIDLKKLGAEKDQMLNEIRRMNEAKTRPHP